MVLAKSPIKYCYHPPACKEFGCTSVNGAVPDKLPCPDIERACLLVSVYMNAHLALVEERLRAEPAQLRGVRIAADKKRTVNVIDCQIDAFAKRLIPDPEI